MSTKKRSKETKISSARPYKIALIEARELMGKSGVTAWKRATLLVEAFNDQDFRLDNGNADDFRLFAILDSYIEDLCLCFVELRQLLEYYPVEGQWASGKLASMWQAMQKAKDTTDKQPVEKPKQTHNCATVAQLKGAQDDCRKERARANAQQLKREEVEGNLKDSRGEIERLRARVAELEAENLLLRQQNSLLQRQLEESLLVV